MKIIGTGIDIVCIGRIKEVLSRTPRMIDKILTQSEKDYCESGKNAYQRIAGRFAAKEAVYKAVSSHIDGLYFRDIEIETTAGGPRIASGCGAYRQLTDNGMGYSLSISHDGDYAAANAVFWSEN